MKSILIPFRTYHFCIPRQSVMKALQLIIDYEFNYSIDNVNDDLSCLSICLSKIFVSDIKKMHWRKLKN